MVITSNSTHTTLNKQLSIQISLSGLSFCILQDNSILHLKEIDFERKLNPIELLAELNNVFETEAPLIDSAFKEVVLIHDNELATVIPKPLFNEEYMADYLKFNSKILKSDFIAYDDILVNDSVVVYVPYININNYIYDKFGTFTYKHISSVLIQEVLSIEKNVSQESNVYINLNKGHFEVLVIKDSKLQFYNSFEYKSKEDFIYYTLFTAEQLNLNPETLKLFFIGNVSKDDDIYNITYKYIRHVDFCNFSKNYQFLNKQAPLHSHFTLINSF
ncbi:DUF3822 family protein [Gaetbulibacter saemankumensis]|uniref:DUF3822 family protein n=1 Tax=Gaetbulibacter saemankumensis TaxID=311208 RepID=UPI000407E819|nr:DUF3822 family protein [Gaetbulibacter saemankumensis]